MTSKDNHLDEVFDAWRETPAAPPPGPHLAEPDLVRLASPGGLAEAAPEELEHLHRCPACMTDWAAWRRAFAVAGELDQEENAEDLEECGSECAVGFLEAAASRDSASGARTLESSCGSWRLEILPNRENRNRGMLVLSRRDRESDSETVVVFDRNGRQILEGPLEDNRLARLCNRLDELDLSVWTVVRKTAAPS